MLFKILSLILIRKQNKLHKVHNVVKINGQIDCIKVYFCSSLIILRFDILSILI